MLSQGKKHCEIYKQAEIRFYQDLQQERPEAFTCLYLQTYDLCLPYALQKGGKQEEAEDLLQDCLAIFIHKLRDGSYVFQEEAKISTYFYRIYVNQWKKSFEQKTKRAEVPLLFKDTQEQEQDDEPFKAEVISIFKDINTEDGELLKLKEEDLVDDYNETERTWVFKKLKRSFELLAADCQQVLHWFYVEDWTLRQIAQTLNMTEASATVKRFKCAKYLKEKFRLV